MQQSHNLRINNINNIKNKAILIESIIKATKYLLGLNYERIQKKRIDL